MLAQVRKVAHRWLLQVFFCNLNAKQFFTILRYLFQRKQREGRRRHLYFKYHRFGFSFTRRLFSLDDDLYCYRENILTQSKYRPFI